MAVSGGLQGQVALVTGAARGQGRAHAIRLAAEGADVIAIDVCAPVSETVGYPAASPEDLAETARAVKANGRRADPRSRCSRSGRPPEGDHRRCREVRPPRRRGRQRWRLELESTVGDVRGTVGHRHRREPQRNVAHHTGRGTDDDRRRKRWFDHHRKFSRGIKATAVNGHYSASKHGLVGLTNALALEVGEYGIRVNSIHPYAVETPMTGFEEMSDILARYPSYLHSLSPMPLKPKDITDPMRLAFMALAEVSGVVVWLAGDGSATLSGSQIAVDRGQLKY
jgi:NAD(P)-dependent dehydrogenase (short-subunit alcohol dehydrogenase family)